MTLWQDVQPLFNREVRSMWKRWTCRWPFLDVKKEQMITDTLHEFQEVDFWAIRMEFAEEGIGIDDCHLKQIHQKLASPLPGFPSKGVVLHHLIVQVHTSHVLRIHVDDLGTLEMSLFVPRHSSAPKSPPMYERLSLGVHCSSYHGDEANIPPADHEDIPPPAVA